MNVKKELNKGCTFKINLDATQVKQELNEIEAQIDRIIEKYEKVGSFAAKHKSNNIINRQLTDYEKEKIDNLNSKYHLKHCNKINVEPLKQDLIKLFNDDEFLWGYVNKLHLINNIFNSFVKDDYLFEKVKLTLEDVKG